MLNDLKQTELDLAEEKILLAVFGSTNPGPKARWLLNFLGIDLNALIRDFEYLVRPTLREDGLVDPEIARGLLGKFGGLVPDKPFRLMDFAEPLGKLILMLKGTLK